MKFAKWPLMLVLGCSPADPTPTADPITAGQRGGEGRSLFVNMDDIDSFVSQYHGSANGEWIGGVKVLHEDPLSPMSVNLIHGGSHVDIECDLVTLYEIDGRNFTLTLSTDPASIDDTVATANSICESFAINNDKLLLWYESKSYDDPLHSSVLESKRKDGVSLSIEVRKSFLPDRPWNCVVQIYARGVGDAARRSGTVTEGPGSAMD